MVCVLYIKFATLTVYIQYVNACVCVCERCLTEADSPTHILRGWFVDDDCWHTQHIGLLMQKAETQYVHTSAPTDLKSSCRRSSGDRNTNVNMIVFI